MSVDFTGALRSLHFSDSSMFWMYRKCSVQCTNHINNANKRHYFLVLLRRAKLSSSDIIRFYSTCIRPLLEYCSPVFHNAISEYLSNDLEHEQKWALSIISPGNSYNRNVELFNMSSLCDRRTKLCRNFFNNIIANPSNKLHHLLLSRNIHLFNLRVKVKSAYEPSGPSGRSLSRFP